MILLSTSPFQNTHFASMKHDKYLSIYYDFSGKFHIGCFSRDNLFSFFFSISMKEALLTKWHHNTYSYAKCLHVVNVQCNLVNPIYKWTDPWKIVCTVYTIHYTTYTVHYIQQPQSHTHTHTHTQKIKSAWAKCSTMEHTNTYMHIWSYWGDSVI